MADGVVKLGLVITLAVGLGRISTKLLGAVLPWSC